MIRKLLPRPLKSFLRNSHRTIVMRRAMKTVLGDPLAAVDDPECLSALVYGWGNEGWSAENDYLRHMVKMVAEIDKQEVLECGSGLSTLLLAATAAKYGGHVTSLENHPGWAQRVRSELERFGLAGVATLLVSPLRSYGAFSWYTVQGDLGPFAGVVCDGPPSTTPGGRYGLIPVMGTRFSPGCRILLDDAAREDEQRILNEWSGELGAKYSMLGKSKPFAELTLSDVAR
jgi:hypothetical protein